MTSNSALELLSPQPRERIFYNSNLSKLSTYPIIRRYKTNALSEVVLQHCDPATIQAALGIKKKCEVGLPPFSRDSPHQSFSPTFVEFMEDGIQVLPFSVSVRVH